MGSWRGRASEAMAAAVVGWRVAAKGAFQEAMAAVAMAEEATVAWMGAMVVEKVALLAAQPGMERPAARCAIGGTAPAAAAQVPAPKAGRGTAIWQREAAEEHPCCSYRAEPTCSKIDTSGLSPLPPPCVTRT